MEVHPKQIVAKKNQKSQKAAVFFQVIEISNGIKFWVQGR